VVFYSLTIRTDNMAINVLKHGKRYIVVKV